MDRIDGPSQQIFIIFLLATAFNCSAEIKLTGFLSVGGGFTYGRDDEKYISDFEHGAVYDKNFSLKPDTLFGIQAQSHLSDDLTVTGQMVARGTDDYDLGLSWAYISYELNDNWTLQVGKKRLSLFHYSDFLEVGYSYHWIRPPTDIYGLPINDYEGLSLLYKGYVDDWDVTIDLVYGAKDGSSPLLDYMTHGLTDRIKITDVIGANSSIGNEWLTVRASVGSAQITLEELNEFADSVNNPGIKVDSLGFMFYGISTEIDIDDWLVVAEYNILDSDENAWINPYHAWIFSVGKRLKKFLPYLAYSGYADYNDYKEVTGYDRKANTYTLGFGFYFRPSAVFKMELTSFRDDSVPNGDEGGGDADLISFAFDMVF